MSYIVTIVVTIIVWELLKHYIAYLYMCSKECVQEYVENTELYKRYQATKQDEDVSE